MSKYVMTSMVVVFALLFSFQNCQNSISSDEVLTQVQNVISSPSQIQLANESLDSINILIRDSAIVTKSGHTYQVNYNIHLKIDLDTGEMVAVSEIDNSLSRYCLTNGLKNELSAILNSAKICKSQPQIPAGVACSQVMRMPYAQLITKREQFDLGSATDGCGSNSIDLCEEHSTLLKSYIESLKNLYKTLSCP